MKSVKRRDSMYPNEISLCREFHHAGMWFTPLVSIESLILRLPRTGPSKPPYHNLRNKAMGLLAIITGSGSSFGPLPCHRTRT
jgi:hypothetical protein